MLKNTVNEQIDSRAHRSRSLARRQLLSGDVDGVRCADLTLERGHRTILLADEAFVSDSTLRASLLEIWERYREPRPGSIPDLARGALRVLRDGPRVGVTDPNTLRRARNVYTQLWEQLPEHYADLPPPSAIP